MPRIDLPTWRPVRDYEGLYEVSDTGLVRTMPKTRNNRHYPQRLLAQVKFQNNRRKVTLTKDGAQTTHRVHRLVAEAFLGYDPRPVLHRDDDASNNRLDNLYYGTLSDNSHDAVRNGVHPQAKKTHCPQGHEYTPENTHLTKKGSRRICRACLRIKSQANRDRAKEAAHG